jgi:hypothetical protein
MFNKSGEILAMLQTDLDTLLLCSNLLCRKLLQVSEYQKPGSHIQCTPTLKTRTSKIQ